MKIVLVIGLLLSALTSSADIPKINQIASGAEFQLSNANLNANPNYYDQFLYQITGDCKKIDTVWFYSTSSWDDAQLGMDSKNRPLFAGVSIQLFRDGTYWAEYYEKAIIEVLPNITRFEVLFEKVLTGTWRMNSDQIEVAGIGIGKPVKMVSPFGMVDGIKFQFTSVFNDKRAMNAVTNVGRVGTNNGPRGISINQYCGVN